jgi:hypothetical protein
MSAMRQLHERIREIQRRNGRMPHEVSIDTETFERLKVEVSPYLNRAEPETFSDPSYIALFEGVYLSLVIAQPK